MKTWPLFGNHLVDFGKETILDFWQSKICERKEIRKMMHCETDNKKRPQVKDIGRVFETNREN